MYIYICISAGSIRARPMRAPGGTQGPGHKGTAARTHGGPTRAQGAHKGPGRPTRARPTRAQSGPQWPRVPTRAQGGGPQGPGQQGPREAHKGPGRPTMARPTRAQSGPQWPRVAHKGPDGPTRAKTARAQTGLQGPLVAPGRATRGRPTGGCVRVVVAKVGLCPPPKPYVVGEHRSFVCYMLNYPRKTLTTRLAQTC